LFVLFTPVAIYLSFLQFPVNIYYAAADVFLISVSIIIMFRQDRVQLPCVG